MLDKHEDIVVVHEIRRSFNVFVYVKEVSLWDVSLDTSCRQHVVRLLSTFCT